MSENTTKQGGQGTRRGPVARTLLLCLLAGLLLGCSTARERHEPGSIVGSLRYRNGDAEAYFDAVFRSGNLYRDFRPVLLVDAIFQDLAYRDLFVRTLQERLLLSEPEAGRMLQAQQREFDQGFDFLLFAYGGNNTQLRLTTSDAAWHILLRDDEGTLLSPQAVTLVKPESPTYRFVESHFEGIDRWTEVYLVRFAKLAKRIIGREPGARPIELIVTGIPGSVTLRWADPAPFYRPAGAGQPPGEPPDNG